MNLKDIHIDDYDYELPDDRIAQHPAGSRDNSKLLVYKNRKISEDNFSNIPEYIPSDSLLIFNNTRVIRARMLFRKETGALIEILCLEPYLPADYALSFSSTRAVEWKCIIGNLKKWKSGLLTLLFEHNGKESALYAEKLGESGEAWIIRFSWDSVDLSFSELIEITGRLPLPPYINREACAEDNDRYQTVYSKIKGSVAAPTAGLHFTDDVLKKMRTRGIKTTEVTLHVGAGTFKPVKSNKIVEHEMHSEHFIIEKHTIRLLIENQGKIIPVGTTSVRTIESLYWLGVKLISKPEKMGNELTLLQWEPYELKNDIPVTEALGALLEFMNENGTENLKASTGIMIVPGYQFRLTNAIVTNFHQPRSTLLLLISAWTEDRWKEIYSYALRNDFRFLSYGDSSVLFK